MRRHFIFFLSTFLGLYNIAAQTIDSSKIVVAASATNMNIVYIGLINPIDIAVSGISAEDIKVITDNGQIIGENGHYFLRPDNLSHCHISIIYNDKIIGKAHFRVQTLRDPLHVTLDGKKGGEIKKNVFVYGIYLKAFFFPTDFDLDVRVISFRIISVKDGEVKDLKKTGDKLNKDMIDFIQSLPDGSPLFIEGIQVKSADGIIRDVDPMSFKLIE